METSYKLENLLHKTAELEASDLYLTVDAKPSVLVQGVLQEIGPEYVTPETMASLTKEATSESQFAELQEKLEMNLSYKVAIWRFRINVYYQRGTPAMVARLIKPNILSVEQLGLPAVLNTAVMYERGIVLVTGATGSGKSTTLAAMIDYRNQNSTGHIVTIEDPIEFVHEHKGCIISQREVGIDTRSYEEALKSALRQAPKVILIGEIRDAETAKFSIHASDTGHLVLATLHTNSANQTLDRILNLFPAEQERQVLMQLGLNLRAIICQRLVPKMDGGRAAAVEIMLNTPRVQDLIMQGNVQELKNVMMKGEREGMQTFDLALLDLTRRGIIDEDTALKFADSSNDLKLRMKGFGGSGFA
ncbi:MAG: PilT/PilU family type 4a pilus ATPase [Candidatus Sumerlaeaceae bacterium]